MTTTFTMPGSDLDLSDPSAVAKVLYQAAQANLDDPKRTGCCVALPQHGRLLATGDIHDNTRSLMQVVKYAKLDRSANNYLVLHELVHGPTRLNGMDLSIRTLARACAVKVQYPEQVFMLLSNHELAQRRQEHVGKSNGSDVDAFNAGLEHLYGDESRDVQSAFEAYVDSQLLAVRCANGVMCAHSLPSPKMIESFDKSVLDRALTEEDYASGGSGHQMVWGRHQNEKIATELAEAWGAKTFILGHQQAEMGIEEMAHNIIILNSDHSHAAALPIDLSEQLDRDELMQYVVPLAAIRV